MAHGRLPSPAPQRIHFYLFASSLIKSGADHSILRPKIIIFSLFISLPPLSNNSKAYQTFYCRLDMADL